MNLIKVSATSRTAAVAGAIAGIVREHYRAEVQAIGAGAVNQAIKALILATGYLRLDGIDVTCVPEFAEVTIEDQVKTAIKLIIEPKHSSNAAEHMKLGSIPSSTAKVSVERPFAASINNEREV